MILNVMDNQWLFDVCKFFNTCLGSWDGRLNHSSITSAMTHILVHNLTVFFCVDQALFAVKTDENSLRIEGLFELTIKKCCYHRVRHPMIPTIHYN